MADRMPTDTLPGEMHEARNLAIEAATYALWQESDAPRPVCAERARIAVNAAWDSLGPLFDKMITREPSTKR